MRLMSLLLLAACAACTVVPPEPYPYAAYPAPMPSAATAPVTATPLGQPIPGQPPQQAQPYAAQPPAPGQAPATANCRDYSIPVTIEGKQVEAHGHACLQPDGSWQVTQTTPGQPPETYTVQLPAYYAAPYPYPYYDYGYPYAYDPWYWGPPYFVGGSLFFGHRFGHFHHFHRGFHGGRHR